ncbi:unnamed protein product [Allacma fusca]|uniref:Carboxylic ester hydrolase n=1 Tax=Allacma fusca TaxID=39272 RepID=A0A8J2JUX4_9HEXA|nr:unnamed protein product [Allacma fusca]
MKVIFLIFFGMLTISTPVTQGFIAFQPLLRFPGGTLMGETGKSESGRDFHKFWCIPYGKHKRFEPSEPADPWTGVRDATFCSVRCPQIVLQDLGDMFVSMPEQEDCLILNVFLPAKIQKKRLLPVMVWIHGGYFTQGSSMEYSGEIFLNEDVVLVTINYRLAILGFLSSGDGILEGNLGLKDQVLALEWVKNNIQYFGGNPNLITIFGQSAGGASISLLLLSPLTKGLFNHAISHSGSSLIPCAFQSKPAENFKALMKELNCSAPTTEESVACLKATDMDEMNQKATQMKWFVEYLYPMFPSVETATPRKSKKFLHDHPRELLKRGKFHHVPHMIGVVEDEGALQAGMAMGDSELLEDLNKRWIPLAGVALGIDNRNITEDGRNEGLRKLREFYFSDGEIGPKDIQALCDMFSDGWFGYSLDFTVRSHAKYAPVYPYLFTKQGAMPFSSALVGKTFNRSVVSHGEDLMYIFFKGLANSQADLVFSKRFLKLWVSFATHGKPTDTWGSEKTWPMAESNTWDYKYYIIDDDTKAVVNPLKKRVQFWNNLWENEFKEHV